MAVRIELPWPNKGLSPNARLHWAAKSRLAKKAKADAYALALAAARSQPVEPAGYVKVAIEFCPPDRRGRDLDNMLSSLKWALDGIAQALGVNDKRFAISMHVAEPCKGGKVVVHV